MKRIFCLLTILFCTLFAFNASAQEERDSPRRGEGISVFLERNKRPGRAYYKEFLELKITSMELLPDVKEKLIEKITILIPLSVLNKALITELAELTKERPGSTELYFKVRDEDSKMTVDLISRPVKLSVGRELITYLKERPDLEFRIN